MSKKLRAKCPTCGRRAPGNPGNAKRDQLIRKSKLSPAQLSTIYHIGIERIYQIRGKK